MKKLFLTGFVLTSISVNAQEYSWSVNIGTSNYYDSLISAEINPLTGEYVLLGRMGASTFNANPKSQSGYNVISDDNHFLGTYNPDGTMKWAFCPQYNSGIKSGVNPTYLSWNDAVFTNSGELMVVGNNDSYYYNFDPLNSTPTISYPPYCYEIIIAGYDPNGINTRFIEIGQQSSCSIITAGSIDADASGNFIVGGFADNNMSDLNFDPGFNTSGLPLGTTIGGFVASYNNSNSCNWVFQLGYGYNDWVTGVKYDYAGNIIAVGTWGNNTLDFNPMGSPVTMTPVGWQDGFIAKYTPAGQALWALNIGSGLDDYIYDLETDASGNIYVSGIINDQCEMNPLGSSIQVSTNSGSHDMFIAKYDSNGSLIWVKVFGDAGYEESVTNLRISNGKLYATGYFAGSVSFDSYLLNSKGNQDGFLLDIDLLNGDVLDAASFGGTSADFTTDAFDNPVTNQRFVLGNFRQQIGLDPQNTGTYQHSSNGHSDYYVATYCYPLSLSHSAIPDVCENAAPVVLTGASLTGGDYSGTGVINNTFYPLITGPGNYSLQYYYENSYSCSANVTTDITVNALPVVLQSGLSSLCENDEPLWLSGGVPAGGLYTGIGVAGGTFDPAITGAGGFLITYTYTDPTTGCSAADNAPLFVYEQPEISLSVTEANCNQNNGGATATISGGTLPYNYYWSNGIVSPINSALYSGQYQITVTDGSGCQNFAIATVSDINGPNLTVNSVTNTLCPGDNNGGIDISVTGGTSPYQYQWSNGSVSEDLNGVPAGTYEITVTDNGGCKAVQSITVGGPAEIMPNPAISQPSCGMSNGSIALNPQGGTAPFTYLWNTTATSSSINSIPLGIYHVTITDANGCASDYNLSLSETGGPDVDLLSTTPSPCNQTTGGVTVNVTGNAPYNFVWNDGSSTVSTVQNLSSAGIGSYTLTVTDNSGCSTIIPAEIEPYFPETSICLVTVDTATGTNLVVWEKDPATFIESYNIYRESSISGQYQLIANILYSDLSQFTDNVANPLVRGWRYRISAVDVCGNESPLSTRHKTIHLTNSIGIGGQINLSWDDYEGFPFSTFNIWRHSDASGYQLIQSLPASLRSYTDITPPSGPGLFYYIEVVPSTPCVSTRAVNHNTTRSNKTQSIVSPTGLSDVHAFADLGIYPQPANDNITIKLEATHSGDAGYEIYSSTGQLVEQGNIEINTGSNQYSIHLDVATGIYQFVIKNGEERLQRRLVIVR
jgi:hypothetical protein